MTGKMLKWIDQPGYLSSNLPWPIHKLVQAAAHSRSICDLGAGILCNVSGCVSLKGSQATGPTSAREVHNLYIQVTSSILYNYIEVVFQKFCSCIVLPDFFRIQIIQAYLEKDVILFVRCCGVSKGRLCKKRSNGPHSWSHLWSLWLSCPWFSHQKWCYNLEICSTCMCWLLFYSFVSLRCLHKNETTLSYARIFQKGPAVTA